MPLSVRPNGHVGRPTSYDNLRANGFTGRVYPVNPKYSEVWGVPCYPNFESLPAPADHALVIIPAKAVIETLTEATAHGLKSATVYAANIGEGYDPEIVARGQALKALCARTGLIVAGPNCMGAMSMREKAFFYPNEDLCKIPVGPVAAVFQSGGTLQFWCQTAASRGVSFSYMISSGNELGVDLADYVNFLVDDDIDQSHRLVHRRHPPWRCFHGGGQSGAGRRQADRRHQDRPFGPFARRRPIAHRRHRRRFRSL